MKIAKFPLLILTIVFLNSCASSYRTVQPKVLNYRSSSASENVVLEYKYDLLYKKYAKKETKKNVKLVAIKITNNSDHDIRFGEDFKLAYENGSKVYTLTNDQTFKYLKQSPATHLFYLLLTPINLYTTKSTGSQVTSNSIPIGLAIGPGLAGGNMIAASSANKKFKNDLYANQIEGSLIEPGKTAYGLIGIKSNSYDALRLAFEGELQENDSDNLDVQH